MTKDLVPIIGGTGGGKGGSPRAAVEAENTLRSKQIAHVIDMLGEGEWEGIVGGPGGIYLNNIPLYTPVTPTNNVLGFGQITDENPTGFTTGKWNFKGVSLEFRPGTQGQSAILTTPTAGSGFVVNTVVTNLTPIIASVSNTEFDIVSVQIEVDQLYQQNKDNGDITGWYVDFAIDARVIGGAWILRHQDRISGKTMSTYVRSYAVNLLSIGEGPWDIRVRRLSPDDPDTSKHSVMRFLSMNLIASEKYRYPNSVLVALGFDASQFSNVPTRSYDVKMMRCRVPTNYNADTKIYTGVWDGSFRVAWTNNPAWCLYEMATNTRFGLGEYFDESLFDKWTLYTIGKYCDQLVPSGFGFLEPRFTLNAYFQSADDAINVLQNMAAVFRGIIYYMGGQLVSVQDAPADPTYEFNSSNVVDGIFNYAGASGSARHTVAMVVWNNPEIQYKQDVEYVEDPVGLVKFGYRPTTIQALGCTSRGQAHRMGLWALFVEQNESDVVTFKTALEATGVQPGHIINVFDPTRAGVRLGGRIIDIAGANVTIDAPVDLPVGQHTISYIADDGSLQSRVLHNFATGAKSVYQIDSSNGMPSIGTIFGIQTASVTAQQFRILTINEAENFEYEITAVSHNASKYGVIELGLTLQTRPTSVVNMQLPGVTNIKFLETIYNIIDETIGIKLSVSWDQIQFAMGYMVSWRKGSGNWSTERMVIGHEFTLNPVSEDVYAVRITSVSILGTKGSTSESQYEVLGEKQPPPPFDYFTCTVQPDGTRQFDFGYSVTLKPVDFKGARIRYFQGLTSNWDIMTPLENEGFYPFSPLETNLLLSGTYTIAAVAEDRTKHQSTPVFIEVTLPDRRLGNVLVVFSEFEDGWPGIFQSCHLDALNNVIEADDTATWDTLPATWDAWTRWIINPASPITYYTPVRDLVSTIAVLLDVSSVTEGSSLVQLRYSMDNVNWSAWLPANTAFTARFFQIALVVNATAAAPVPTIHQLVYQVGGKVKKESLNDVSPAALTGFFRNGVGDVRVPIASTYTVISRVTVMAIQDPTPGWTWLLGDKSVQGPRVLFFKNGVAADPALVDFYLEGY